MTKNESKATRSDIKFAAKLLAGGYLNEDTQEHCQRGLEYQTTLGALRRNRVQVAACDAVLDEQEFQFHQCDAIIEPCLIAAAYQPISKSALEKARLIALQDERDAMVL